MAVEQFRFIVLSCVYTFISQIITSHAQYIQYAGAPYPFPGYITGYPIQSFAPSPAPIYNPPYSQPVSNYQPTADLRYKTSAGSPTSYAPASPVTPTFIPAPAQAVSTPVIQATAYQTPQLQQPFKAPAVTPITETAKLELINPTPYAPKESSPRTNPSLPKDLLPTTSPPFDSNVLNNLAIALQLLIVSNLLNSSPLETNPASQTEEDIFPEIAPLPIAYIPASVPEASYSNQYMPNANFLGTANFGDTGITKSMMNGYGAPTIPAPRPSALISPYDAIGPNSPFLDIFKAKPEPKLPHYHTSDYKDLFSLTELFKI